MVLLIELQNDEIFPVSLLKSDFTADILRAILKIHGIVRGNYFGRISFQYISMIDRLDSWNS